MSKDNRTSYDRALANLRIWFDIVAEVDFFDVIASGKTPAEVRRSKLGESMKKEADKDDNISYLFQDVQKAYFAHEIVTHLNANYASNQAVKSSINVICESSKTVSFGEATPGGEFAATGFPDGTKKLKCDLSKFTTAVTKKNEKGKIVSIEELHPDGSIKINKTPTAPNRSDAPCLSAIVVNSTIKLPTNRSTGGADLFLNHIPTLEMSRCIPHLEITISAPHGATAQTDGKNFINGVSFSRFLLGNAEVPAGSGTEFFVNAIDNRLRPNYIATASQEKLREVLGQTEVNDWVAKTSAMGMEAFTSPQTMTMADESFSDGHNYRTAPILDRFRPFMSIKSFKIDVKSTFGLIQSKTGNLTLVLHDRSRLSEISELIKVDTYGSTEILIEYGWNHPEPHNSNNPWGEFLNSLKLMEKYQIASSSYSFDEVGQVNINLKVALKGESDVELIKVGTNEFHVSGVAALMEITKAVQAFKKSYPDFPEQKAKSAPDKPRKGVKSTELWNFNVGDFSDAKSFLSLDNKEVNQMRRWVRSQGWKGYEKKQDRKKLVEIFKGIFSRTKKNPSLLEQIKTSIGEAISRKIDTISLARLASLSGASAGKEYKTNVVGQKSLAARKAKYKKAGDLKAVGEFRNDPFLYKSQNQLKTNINTPSNILDTTNFGTLFMNFVARPLAASGNYDEVQVIFYCFNHFASQMRDVPISSFPIDIGDFKKAYSERVKNGNAMFLTDFVSFINSEYTANPSYRYGYGFGKLYTYDKKEKKHVMVKKYQENTTELNTEKMKILAKAYGVSGYEKTVTDLNKGKTDYSKMPDLKFVQPRVSASFECLPSSKSESHTILRIQVFDAANSGNDLLEDMMKCSSSDKFASITRAFKNADSGPSLKERKKRYVNQINAYLKSELIKVQGSNVKEINESDLEGDSQMRFVVTAGANAVKRECKSRMANILYGAANTNIISANVNSNAPPGLFEINLTRANLGHGRTALGARQANLPVEFAPIQLSIKSMGFPFFYIGQEFFVDFNTGTTVDNVYRLVEVSHELSDGGFSSSVKFSPAHAYGSSKAITSVIADALKLFESKS